MYPFIEMESLILFVKDSFFLLNIPFIKLTLFFVCPLSLSFFCIPFRTTNMYSKTFFIVLQENSFVCSGYLLLGSLYITFSNK